jgi:hypothetical protein
MALFAKKMGGRLKSGEQSFSLANFEEAGDRPSSDPVSWHTRERRQKVCEKKSATLCSAARCARDGGAAAAARAWVSHTFHALDSGFFAKLCKIPDNSL